MKRFARAGVITTVASLILVLGASILVAQSDRAGRRQDRGERRQWDPAQMRQRMVEHYKENLNSPDEEWKVIQPLLEKVVEKQFMMGSGMRFGRRRPGAESATATNPLSEAAQALRTALDSEDTPVKEIEQKTKALRKARKAAEADLTNARKDLRKVLTVRQEAQLLLGGVLD